MIPLRAGVFLLLFLCFHCDAIPDSFDQIINNNVDVNGTDYWQRRADFIANEESQQIGNAITLSEREKLVNVALMREKSKEFDAGIDDPSEFLAGQHFFHAKEAIERSFIFHLIQKMPKGAVLHSHDSAMTCEDFIFNLTFVDNLFMCEMNDGCLRFQFAYAPPKGIPCDGKWSLLSELRANTSNLSDLNSKIRQHLTLRVEDPFKVYPTSNAVWDRFRDIFMTVVPILTYRPVLELYFYEVFQELYDDNIMYLEFRGTLPPAYELNGTVYNEVEVVALYKQVLEKFKKDHPEFYGARFIYAPYRHVTNKTFDHYINVMHNLTVLYPDFVAGFDLVGQEDQGYPLYKYIEKLQTFPPFVKFFFHAGETNWYGSYIDMDLVDAILLQTHRIGHGFSIIKHPAVMSLVKSTGTAIEVCPISNQVLRLVDDLRNHPANMFLAHNLPVVIANDDPAFWGAKGLSYDFYMAFMAFTSREADLRVLKQLAINSIIYSAMSIEEQGVVLGLFEKQWQKFIDLMLIELGVDEHNFIVNTGEPFVTRH